MTIFRPVLWSIHEDADHRHWKSRPRGLRASIVARRTVHNISRRSERRSRRCPGDPYQFDPDPIRGFDSAKWHDLRYNNEKYKLGRALVDLAPTAENLKRVAESQGLQYLGKDLVALSDGTVVDCIYDFEGPKARWQFQLSH
jgi:hypothetical protein